MKKIFPLLLLALCVACGPTQRAARQLRKAERLIRSAEINGAKVEADTVFKSIHLHVPGPTFETKLENPSWLDTLYISIPSSKPEIGLLKLKIKRTPAQNASATSKPTPEIVYIQADCPDQYVDGKVPVTVTNKISAGYTLWEVIVAGLAGIAFGIGATLLYKIFK